MYQVKVDDFGYGLRDDFSFYGPKFETIRKAAAYCEKLHDMGDEDDMMIVNLTNDNMEAYFHAHDLDKVSCPVCGKNIRHMDLVQTHDCHGIPYRRVCGRCYEKIMSEQGYDGVYYDETDECLDE